MKYPFVLGLLACSLVLSRPAASFGAAGDLDPGFGNAGKLAVDFSQTDDYAFAVLAQPDGAILTAGHSGVYPNLHAALFRAKNNGTPDSSFGSAGRVTTNFGSSDDFFGAIVETADGKIIAAGGRNNGRTGNDFLVARFNADGSLDTSFAGVGWATVNFGDSEADANAVLLQTDGRIVLAGVTGAGSFSDLNDFALARFESNGVLDTTFGDAGKVVTHFPGVFNTGSTGTGAALQRDGKIIVGGTYKNQNTSHQFALARYNTDGSLDLTFGRQGLVMTKMMADAHATSLALQRDGRIVLAGYSDLFRANDVIVARYNSRGTLDRSFASIGFVITDLGGGTDDIAYHVAVQPDGKIVTAGRTGHYPIFDFAVERWTTDGQLDSTFGASGKVATDFGNSEQSYGLALQNDGAIVIAGYAISNRGDTDFALARYLGQ